VLLIGLIMAAPPVGAQDDASLVLTLDAHGAVTPAMREYISRGLELAEQRGADLIILQLNTPGGDIGTTLTMSS